MQPFYFQIYYTHFEITVSPCNLIASNWCDLFTNGTFFCFKSHLFPAKEEATLKTKQPIRFQGLFTVTNQIARMMMKMKDKEYHMAKFATFVSKTLTPPPPPQNG